MNIKNMPLFFKKCTSTHTIAKNLFSNNIENFSLAKKEIQKELNLNESQVKKLISNKKNFFISSKEMTHGVTRKDGVSWFSPKGNIYLTMIFFKDNLRYRKEKQNILSNFQLIATTAVCVFKFIRKFIRNSKIKWPNDIIIESQSGDKKICGIMSENLKNVIILSLAFNVDKFPDQTSNFPATSILNENKNLSKEDLEILQNTQQVCFKLFKSVAGSFEKIQKDKKNFEYTLKFFTQNTYKINQNIKIKYKNPQNQEIIEILKLKSISFDGEMIFEKNNQDLILTDCEIIN